MSRFRLEDLPLRHRKRALEQLGGAPTTGQVRARCGLEVAASATDELVRQLEADGLPGWIREYRFHESRRWRFDLAFRVPRPVAIEIEGGIHPGGKGHTDHRRVKQDIEKYNEAAIAGWLVVRVTHAMIRDGSAVDVIRRALERQPYGGKGAGNGRRTEQQQADPGR